MSERVISVSQLVRYLKNKLDHDLLIQKILIEGEISSPINLPDECRFAPRCRFACEKCRNGNPPLEEVSPGHFVACCRWQELSD